MSFEGHYQIICKNGHYHEVDCDAYDYEDFVFNCGDLIDGVACKAPERWSNLVDDTNCDEAGKVEIVELTPRIIKRCNLGCNHIWTAATYAPAPNGVLGLLIEPTE